MNSIAAPPKVRADRREREIRKKDRADGPAAETPLYGGRAWWLALVLVGCIRDTPPLEGAPCPCLAGFTCCPLLGCVSGAACVTPDGAEPEVAVDAASEDAALDGAVDAAVEAPEDMAVVEGPAFVDLSDALGEADLLHKGRGLTLVDFDRDDRIDLIFGHGAEVSPFGRARRYRNLGGLAFEDVTVGVLGDQPWYRQAVPGDFDGDGRLDLVLTFEQGVVTETSMLATLLRGRGGPAERLTIEHVVRHNEAVVLAGADVDGDGDPDLVGCRILGAPEEPDRLLLHLANEGGAFAEVAHPPGPPVPAGAECRSQALGDLDADGDADLVLCGKMIRVFLNENGSFRDATATLAPELVEGAQQPACAEVHLVDFDTDGHLDLVWTTTGSPLVQAGTPSVLGVGLARWSGGRFWGVDVDVELPDDAGCLAQPAPWPGLSIGYLRTVWFDADLDGRLDVLLAQPYFACPRPPYLLRRRGAGYEVTPLPLRRLAGMETLNASNGTAVADLDGDGDLDVVLHAWSAASRRLLLRNDLGGQALRVVAISDADGDATDPNTSDDAALWAVRVELDVDGPVLAPDFTSGRRVETTGRAGYLSFGPPEARFGLGSASPPLWVRAFFPDGSRVVRRVDAFDAPVELRDCPEVDCR